MSAIRQPREGVPLHAHGTNGYTNYGCRCTVCTIANTRQGYRRRQERKAETARYGLPEGVTHGASAYGNWGCRCAICTAAWASTARRHGKAAA